MVMAASVYNPSASFPAGGWAVLFLDAGQQIIRAALLPRVQCTSEAAAWSLARIIHCCRDGRSKTERHWRQRQTDRQTDSEREKESVAGCK